MSGAPERAERPTLSERLGDWIGKLPFPGRTPPEESGRRAAQSLPTATTLASDPRLPEALRARIGAGPADSSMPERKPTLERIQSALRAGASVALVGPRASGKSTLIERALAELAESGVATTQVAIGRRLHGVADLLGAFAETLGAETNERDAVLAALAEGPGRVLALDPLHALARRRVGGLAPLIALLDLISATRGRHVWLVGCDDQAWTLLDRRVDLDETFPVRIATGLDPASLRAALESELAAAGVELRFRAVADARGADPAERFYAALHREVRGSFEGARLQLLAQGLGAGGSEPLELGEFASDDLAFVRALDRPSLVTLTSVLQHAGLTPAEHADVLLVKPEGSRRRLAALAGRGLLLAPAEPEGCYVVNPAIEARLVRHLHDLNLLPRDAIEPSA